MKFKLSVVAFLMAVSLVSAAQVNLRPVEQLINEEQSAWPIVQKMVMDAKNKVETLPADATKSKEALYKTQVTTRSPLGTVIFNTGGILVDGGWIRILGSGSTRIQRNVPEWNAGKSFNKLGERPAFLLVADDAAGGFFAINGSGLGPDEGKVYYLSPDDLEWEDLELTYTEFLNFCFNGNLADFFRNVRWNGWQKDVATLGGDKVYTFFPYLFTKEGKDINKTARNIVPIAEHYDFITTIQKELGISK